MAVFPDLGSFSHTGEFSHLQVDVECNFVGIFYLRRSYLISQKPSCVHGFSKFCINAYAHKLVISFY